jgi:CBS domain containing-hemolysin-like protein
MISIFTATLLIIFLTLLSGLCSASEAALFSLSSIKVRNFKTSNDYRQRLVAQLLSQPRDLLVTVFLLNTIVNILLQNVVSDTFLAWGGWLMAVGLPFILLLIFGEIVPKYIGIQNNVKFSLYSAPTTQLLHRLLMPVRKLIVAFLTPITKIFSFLKKDAGISKEEMEHVLNESQEAGILNAEERELITGYLNLQDSTVREIMRPRQDILYYDMREPITKLIHLFVDKQCARIPVIEKEMDNMLGVIDDKQFFLYRNHLKEPKDLIKFLQKPFYIPETTPSLMLLKKLDENNQELALVVDEYGSISGLIAYEDIVEVVVGQISDQRDLKALYTRAGKNEIIASGKLELTDFNDLFNTHLSSESMVTLGGWLTEQTGDIPKSGTKFKNDQFLFQVLAADPNRVRRIYVRRLSEGQNS